MKNGWYAIPDYEVNDNDIEPVYWMVPISYFDRTGYCNDGISDLTEEDIKSCVIKNSGNGCPVPDLFCEIMESCYDFPYNTMSIEEAESVLIESGFTINYNPKWR